MAGAYDEFIAREPVEQGDGYREPDQLCPYCEATVAEGHHDTCSLFKPRCACGRWAKRMIAGRFVCSTCAPHGKVQAA